MPALSKAARDRLPSRAFADPEARAYPIEDKAHARTAKARASQAERAGRMTKGDAERVRRRADRVLGGD